MNILEIIPYFYPAQGIGGTSQAVFSLSKRHVSKGHSVSVYTTDLNNKSERLNIKDGDEKIIDGVKITYFKNISNTLAFSQHIFFPPRFFIKLQKTLSNFDIIHFHELYTFLHLWGCYLAEKRRVPFVLSAHSTAGILREAGRVKRKIIFNKIFGERIIKNASGLIALTDHEKKDYLSLGAQEEKIQVIPNGVDISRYFVKKADAESFKKKHKLKKSDKIVLFLGRVHPKKGLEILLKALGDINKDKINSRVKLVIAGIIENKKYYLKIQQTARSLNITKEIIFTGVLSEEEKRKAFAVCDVFVLPSFGEGIPVSALEAAAAGLPLILSKKCHLKLVDKYKAGAVIDNNAQNWEKTLVLYLNDENRRKRAGKNAKKMIKENYSLDIMAKKTEEFYLDITCRT